MLKRVRPASAVALLISTVGCATPGPQLTDSVTAMRTAVEGARSGTRDEFDAINLAARDDSITRLVVARKPPAEADFSAVIDDATAAQWTAMFDGIDLYLATLEQLVSSDRAASVTSDINAAATTLQGGAFQASIPPGIAGLFANLAGDLLRATADRKAQEIMLRTDASFLALTRGMADRVDAGTANQRGTLRALVDDHWSNVLAGLEHDYGKIAAEPDETRRALISDYGTQIAKRDAERRKLTDIRAALLAVGAAHSAAAKSNRAAALYWIGQIGQHLQDARTAMAGEVQ